MAAPPRLKRIANLASITERIAAQRLQSTRVKHDDNLAKLADFRRYLDEYRQNFAQVGSSISANSVREFQGFLQQLHLTIQALEMRAHRSAQDSTEELETWKRESHRVQSLLSIVERNFSAAEKRAEQSLQNEIDDSRRLRDEA
jgi:flagellar export protein FliJ